MGTGNLGSLLLAYAVFERYFTKWSIMSFTELLDDNLQSHGTKALSGVMTTGTATLTRGRPLSYSMRKRVHSLAANRGMEIPKSDSRVNII